MPELKVILNGDGCWPDLAERRVVHLGNGAPPIQVAGLEGGMTSGAASVSIRVDLPDGTVVVAETSLRLFLAAAAALSARFGTRDGSVHPGRGGAS